MSVVGFDFGTTNSLISFIKGRRAISILENDLPVPSVVCYEGTQVIVGHEARARLANAGLGVHGNVVRSPKSLLGRENVLVGEIERNPTDIVRDVVREVRRKAQADGRTAGMSLDQAVVTIPINMVGSRRAALRDAFRMAGFRVVQFVHEPLAALYAYIRSAPEPDALMRRLDRQLLLVCDWGGGTLDLTLCSITGGVVTQIANDGTDDVGGDVFDQELRNELVTRARRKQGLGEGCTPGYAAMARLVHDAERSKIALSRRERVQVYVPDFFPGGDESVALEYTLERSELDTIVAHLLRKGLRRVETLLERSGYAPSSLHCCLATGGMANMPAIQAGLHQIFGPDRVILSNRSATMIAEGAAWVAHDNADLLLAKNVELVLARDGRLPLVVAGTRMPKEGGVSRDNVHVYCCDPRDGHAKLQLEAPRRPGRSVLTNEPRDVLGLLSVAVDSEARALRERIELTVSIDDNLILRADALSLNQRATDSVEVHNLEFSLALPGHDADSSRADDPGAANTAAPTNGAVVIRVNVADSTNPSSIPGELLHKENHRFIFEQSVLTEEQRHEHLYYQPCSYCKLASHDARCRCASNLRLAPT